MKRVAVIGNGAIGAAITREWQRKRRRSFALVAILVRPARAAEARRIAPRHVPIVTDINELLDTQPEIVTEAASHDAVEEFGVSVLQAGCQFHILSVGALTDDQLRADLDSAAASGRGRVTILSGALAGFDGLLSLRAAGLRSVSYTCTKPICAWRGTAAEAVVNLDALDTRQTVFSGNAREAARRFPQNANLAAAVAIAGIGFERTHVELVADPAADGNTCHLQAISADEVLDVNFTSAYFSGNPRTSQVTAMSAIAAIEQEDTLVRF